MKNELRFRCLFSKPVLLLLECTGFFKERFSRADGPNSFRELSVSPMTVRALLDNRTNVASSRIRDSKNSPLVSYFKLNGFTFQLNSITKYFSHCYITTNFFLSLLLKSKKYVSSYSEHLYSLEAKQPLSKHLYHIFSSDIKFYFIIPIHKFGLDIF